MNIGPVQLGPGNPCAVVAEISNSHNGTLERAVRLLHAAKAAGADIVKVQAYTPDELVALRGDGPAPSPWHRYTMRELYSKARTPLAWMATLFGESPLPIYASVFGAESLS